jgi:hypothetical protein
MNSIDSTANDESRPKRKVSTLGGWLTVLAAMSVYAFLSLLPTKIGLRLTVALLYVLTVVEFIRSYRSSRKIVAWTNTASAVVALLALWGAYRHTITAHNTFLFATVLYRPYFTRYCNRRLMIVVTGLIVATILLGTCGIVTNSDLLGLLGAFYALMVATLWAFCSKFGATVFGFEPSEE